MTEAAARRCSRNPCRNTTTDPTGRCHLHRGTFTSRSRPGWLPTVPTPAGSSVPETTWTQGEVHPTGDFDGVADDGRGLHYTRAGLFHRLDGPAIVTRDNRGSITSEEWWAYGRKHRDDGPAERYYEGDSVYAETYYENGLLHRLDGPADLGYDLNGDLIEERYLVQGEVFTTEQFGRLRDALDSGAPLEWACAFAKGQSS